MKNEEKKQLFKSYKSIIEKAKNKGEALLDIYTNDLESNYKKLTKDKAIVIVYAFISNDDERQKIWDDTMNEKGNIDAIKIKRIVIEYIEKNKAISNKEKAISKNDKLFLS